MLGQFSPNMSGPHTVLFIFSSACGWKFLTHDIPDGMMNYGIFQVAISENEIIG